MKRILIISLMLAIGTLLGHAQQSYFDKYADMEGMSSVYISKSMLRMFPDMSGKINGVNVGNLAGRLDHIQILSSEEAKLIELLRKETKDVSPAKGYEELMRVRDDGDKVNMYFKEDKKGKNEFVLIADGKDEFTIISIVGDLTLEEMQGMVEEL